VNVHFDANFHKVFVENISPETHGDLLIFFHKSVKLITTQKEAIDVCLSSVNVVRPFIKSHIIGSKGESLRQFESVSLIMVYFVPHEY